MKNYDKLQSGPGIQPNTGKHEPPRRTSDIPEQGFIPAAIDVERRAYEIHQQRGGSSVDNWLEAERALKEESGQCSDQNQAEKMAG